MSADTAIDAIERLHVDDVRSLAADKLVRQLAYVADGSAFYARKWGQGTRRDAGKLDAGTVEDFLQQLPFTTKDELRIALDAESPFGEHLLCSRADVARIHRTSGTTGRPLIVALTSRDAAVSAAHGARAFRAAGLRSEDIVVHCLSYCMWSGGMSDHMCLEATGAAVVPFGVGNTDTLLALPTWVPFTALSCTPTYVVSLVERLTEEQRALWAANLRLLLVGGEPGGSNVALQRLAEDAFGATVANANYGLAEILTIFGGECEARSGMHFHGQEALWPDIIDPDTLKSIPIAPGARGELVLTHIDRQAQPVVRYRCNDILEILSTDRCECGRGGFRFALRGRADDMFVVRGVNVFPSAIAEALGEVAPGLSEFVIRLGSQETFDFVPLEVEAPSDVDEALTTARIVDQIKRRIGCTAEVTLVPRGTLPRGEGKTQRVLREASTSHEIDAAVAVSE